MIETHLRELLRLLVPTEKGRAVTIDGYALLNSRESIHPLFAAEKGDTVDEPGPLDVYEPRIGYIRNALESLLSVVELEVDGKAVQPEGFRIKNLRDWLSPGGGANEILAHAASRCNLRCRFCYNEGAPPALRWPLRDPERDRKELETRIARYVPQGRLSLFPEMGSPCEPLTHPHILEALGALRDKTEELFRIPSNGSTLTGPMIRALAEMRPISVDVSLNSADPERRSWLMGDPHPQVALDSLARLRAEGIPYSVVIVPWPFPSRKIMLEDLIRTVGFAAAHDPTLIQVSLPGYSRFFSAEELFPHEEIWGELRAAVQEARETIECPVVLRPGLFEEYPDPELADSPRVIGVVKNSPAARAGLRPGDQLLKISGLPVRSRREARSLLTVLHQSHLESASIRVQRNGTALGLEVGLRDFAYPYSAETCTHLGAVFSSSGVPREWLEPLQQVVASRRAKDVLLLSSFLVRPVLERLVCESGRFAGVNLNVRVPGNDYLGGNICMGDLLVVRDFIAAVDAFAAEKGARPDLVVIPSSPFHLGRWGRDLEGREYLEIERRTRIPVALVECEPIFD
jgi:uncharacterized Fe-S cluster-containing radical SAM superfamily protein